MFVGEGDPAVLERWAAVDGGGPPLLPGRRQPPAPGPRWPLVRTVASYEAYWSRGRAVGVPGVGEARAVAGDPELGAQFDASARHHLWERVFTADDLRSCATEGLPRPSWPARASPRRSAGPGRAARHRVRRAAPAARARPPRPRPPLPTTLTALAQLAASGCRRDDAEPLADAYRSCAGSNTSCSCTTAPRCTPCPPTRRRAPASPAPSATGTRRRSAWPSSTGPRHHQGTVRTIHERLTARWRPSPEPTPTSWPSRAVEAG